MHIKQCVFTTPCCECAREDSRQARSHPGFGSAITVRAEPPSKGGICSVLGAAPPPHRRPAFPSPQRHQHHSTAEEHSRARRPQLHPSTGKTQDPISRLRAFVLLWEALLESHRLSKPLPFDSIRGERGRQRLAAARSAPRPDRHLETKQAKQPTHS